MLKNFRAFLLRGNVVDLAVGVAIGAAFTSVVTAVTAGIITPLLGLLGGGGDVKGYAWHQSGSVFGYGLVLSALIDFVLVAAVLFFGVVVPVNALMARRKTEPEVAATTKDCRYCLSSIPVAATRCAFCTSEV